MNPEPTIFDELERAGHTVASAVRKALDKVPFIDKGVLPAVFLPVLLIAAYYQSGAFWGAMSSDVAIYTWKPARATVMDATVSGETLRALGQQGGVETANADLNLHAGYRYSFGNRTYESTSVGIGNSSSSTDNPGLRPAEWVRDHPKGSRIDVLVNPRNPEMSAIDPRPTFAQALVMLIAMPFTLLGLSGVLTERAQVKLHYERLIGGWGVLTVVIFALGNALVVSTGVAIAIYFAAWFAINRYSRKKWVSDIEEDVNAPPMDITEFRP